MTTLYLSGGGRRRQSGVIIHYTYMVLCICACVYVYNTEPRERIIITLMFIKENTLRPSSSYDILLHVRVYVCTMLHCLPVCVVCYPQRYLFDTTTATTPSRVKHTQCLMCTYCQPLLCYYQKCTYVYNTCECMRNTYKYSTFIILWLVKKNQLDRRVFDFFFQKI